MIPENDLPAKFIEKLSNCYSLTCKEFELEVDLRTKDLLNNLHDDATRNNLMVTFDYHNNCEVEESDNGEVVDVFIGGSACFIAIEVKYEKGYDFDKDIIQNHQRITEKAHLYGKNKIKSGIQVLLITEKKHKSIKSQRSKKNSNYIKLKSWLLNQQNENVFIVIFREDILKIISENRRFVNVENYIIKRLQKV